MSLFFLKGAVLMRASLTETPLILKNIKGQFQRHFPRFNEKYSVAGKIRLHVHVQSSPCCC